MIGSSIFATYIWLGRGVLKPSLRPPRLTWAPMRDILRVGTASSIVSISTNLSIAAATGLAGLIGPAAVAGYGTGARLEYLLVPMVFGMGAPLAAMVGTSIGAGTPARAYGCLDRRGNCRRFYRMIGIAAALMPHAWLTLFGSNAQMVAVGAHYLRSSDLYGFFGGGLALYFASQGAGRLGWPMVAAVVRVAIAAGGGWLAVKFLGGERRAIYLTCNSARDIRRHQCVGDRGGVWFGRPKPSAAVLTQPS